jgi:DeoR family transcriptional regulator, suf operon transcriptional repressor
MSHVTISTAGLRVMKLLVGNPPQTVSELIRAAGVTRTAVTEQLNELVAAGFVERNTERLPGRGRPRHLYKATQAALLLLFANNQRLVVPAIWQAIRESGGDSLTKTILQQVSQSLAEHYSSKLTARKPEERLRQFIDLLMAEGGLIEAVEGDDGRLIIYKRSCPFISMVDSDRNVCHIDEEMMTAVVGRPVHKTSCRHQGAPCCTFEVVK